MLKLVMVMFLHGKLVGTYALPHEYINFTGQEECEAKSESLSKWINKHVKRSEGYRIELECRPAARSVSFVH